MSSNYTGNPTLVDSPSPAPNLAGNYPIATLPADGDALTAASVGQEARLGPNWLAYIVERYRDMIFGDGSDGALTVNAGANVNLTSLKFYSTVSVTFGQLRTNGWPIIARNSISITGSGSVSGTGGSASGASRGTALAGFNLDGPHMHVSPSSGIVSSTQYIGASIYGYGGQGGNGGGTVSGSNLVVSPGNAYKQYPYRFCAGPAGLGVMPIYNGPVPGPQYDSIRGGAAGNPGDALAGIAGGGGGAGGALVILIAPSITITGGMLSQGGSGSVAGGTNAHGGGGGGGGAFLYICQTLSGTAAYYSVGNGTGGLNLGTGIPGTNGAAGNATPYIVMVP